MKTRRVALGVLAAPFIVPALRAQAAFPNRPLRLIVTYPPGGVTDIVGRISAEALGRAAGLPEALAPGVHNFAGGAGAGMSVGVLAMLCGLLADGTRPGQVWRLLAPSMALVVALGCAAVWLLR